MFDLTVLEGRLATAKEEALQGAIKARLLRELEEAEEAERRSLRWRVASALVQLGLRIDPEAGSSHRAA